MSLQEQIIKAAILGTDKYEPTLSGDLEGFFNKLDAQAEDKEDKFLKRAATAFLYLEAGIQPLQIPETIPACPPETKQTASRNFSSQLKAVLEENNEPLLEYALHLIHNNNLLVNSELVPHMLQKALGATSSLKNKILQNCGETGKWMASLNNEWKILYEQESEDVWQTGKPAARREFLKSLRQEDPAAARQLLSESIEKENANTRAEFLETLSLNLSLDDEAFLLLFLKDKSQKVKQIALDLLKGLEGSTVNQKFLEYALQALQIKISSQGKKSLEIKGDETLVSPLLMYGVEAVSPEKGVSDQLFWIKQIISFVNPVTLAQKLSCELLELLEIFLEHPKISYLHNALSDAIIRFDCKTWANYLLYKSSKYSSPSLLKVLELSERGQYYQHLSKQKKVRGSFLLGPLLEHFFDENYTEFDEKLAEAIMEDVFHRPYDLNNANYKLLALYIPAKLTAYLKKFQTFDDTSRYEVQFFKNQVFQMLRIMEIKQTLTLL